MDGSRQADVLYLDELTTRAEPHGGAKGAQRYIRPKELSPLSASSAQSRRFDILSRDSSIQSNTLLMRRSDKALICSC